MTAAIDPAGIPGAPGAQKLDPHAVDDAADDLRADAARIRDEGAEVPRAWQGLAAHYEAPEAGQLLAVMDPVGRTTDNFAEDLERVAAALASFAMDLREVKARFDQVRFDAVAFRNKIAGNLEWEFDQELIHENNRLLSAANSAAVDLQDAERRCANQIRAIDQMTPLHVSTGAADDPLAYGVSHISLDTPMPWGESVARQDHCPKAAAVQVKRAVWDGFGDDVLLASVEGFGAFFGFDSESGERSLETAEAAWTGLGLLVGHDAQSGEQSWDIFGTTWTEMGKGLIAWDMWEEDPARAVGTSVGNIALLFATAGVGVAAKVGTAGKLGGVLKTAQAVNVVNRVLDPLEWATAGVRATAGLRGVMGGLGRSVEVDLPELDVSPDLPVAGRPEGGGDDNPLPGRGAEPPAQNPGFKADNSVLRDAVPAPVVREPVMAEASLSAGGRHADELVPAGVGAQADTVLERGGQPDTGRGHGDTGGGAGHGGGEHAGGRGDGGSGGGYGGDGGPGGGGGHGDAGPGSGAGHGTEGPPEGDRFGDGIRDSDGGEQDPSTVDTLDTAGQPVDADAEREVVDVADQDLDVGGDAQPSRPDAPDAGDIVERYSAPDVAQHLSGEAPSPRKPFAALDNLEPNTAYEVPNRGTFYTDDAGKVVHVEAQYGSKGKLNWDLMHPQPDVTYVVNDHVFVTDHAGRTIEAYTDDLQFGDADRSKSIQSRIGNIGGDEYDGGHLLANMFAGGPEDINLVPMLSDLNQGNSTGDTFYAVEQELRSKLRPPADSGPDWEPPRITFKVVPDYEGESRVPIAISVEYTVDGVTRRKRFINE
ncbi:DNA/RNA non-specific endonuclease [Promicromonospora sp. NPDC023805]|uniref:DNA/RNA non-specific endonuclease n=1 Tax=Promicromonospora sp. NPDC023805 TaxID=3154696 RepID=UPI0033F8F4D8